MTEKVGLQQRIQQFRQENPNLKNLSEKQILSIMVENGHITLTEAQKNSIYSQDSKQTNNNGLAIEKDSKTQTIILNSGKRIIIKDGIQKYYTENGTELQKEDFEKTEGEINIKPSGRYSITKSGKTSYYAANGTEINEQYFKQVENTDVKIKSSDGQTYNLNKTLEKRINLVSQKLQKTEDDNGFIGKTWSGFKNLTGIGDSSDKVREIQTSESKLLEQFNANEQRRPEIFKQLTGSDYTPENLEKFLKGEIKLKSEQALLGYKEGQEMAVDIGADIISGVVSVGIYSAAVAAAPFSGGSSIAVGIAAAGTSGAAIKASLKASDAYTGGREYNANDLAKDTATGAFSGILAPVTGGMGGAVGKTVATKLGIQATKQVGKKIVEETAETGIKQSIKTALTNPTGYEYVGGNILKQTTAYSAEVAVDGSISGAVDNAFRTALDGGTTEEILQASKDGALFGMAGGLAFGNTFKAIGKGGHKLGEKVNEKINIIKNTSNDEVKTIVHTEQTPPPNTTTQHLPEEILTPTKPNSQEQMTNSSEQIKTSDNNTNNNETLKPQNQSEIPKEKLEALKKDLLKQETMMNGHKVNRFATEQADHILELYANDQKFIDEILNKKNSFFTTLPEFEYDEIVKIAQYHTKNKDLTEYLVNKSGYYDVIGMLELLEKDFARTSDKEKIEILNHFEELIKNSNLSSDMMKIWLKDKTYFTLLNYKVKDKLGNENYLIQDINLLWDIGEQKTKNLRKAIDNGNIDKLVEQCTPDYGGYTTLTDINQDGTLQICASSMPDKISIQYAEKRIDFKVDQKGSVKIIAKSKKNYIPDNNTKTLPDGSTIVDYEISNNDITSGIIKEFYSPEGKLVRKDEIKQSDKIKGAFEITTSRQNEDGVTVTEKIGSIKQYGSKQQGSRTRVRVISPTEIKTDQIKMNGPKGRGSTYKIIDKNQNILYENKRTSRMITPNHYRSSHNGINYDMKFENNNVIVSKINSEGLLEDTITFDTNSLDPQLIDLYKQLPGDYFYKLKKYGINVELGGSAKKDNACFTQENSNNIPKICMSEEIKNDPFVFAHELGHAIDHLEFNDLLNDKKFISIYKAEMEKFKQKSSMNESNSIYYFINNDDEYEHFKEFVAETHALISGLENNQKELGIRSVILQQNFPRLIAYVAKKFEDI